MKNDNFPEEDITWESNACATFSGGLRALAVCEIIILFKDCKASTITDTQHSDFSKHIREFNATNSSSIREARKIDAIYRVFDDAKFSAFTQGLLRTNKFTDGMNKIGLLPHEAALMLNANDNGVNFLRLNKWLLELPPTYNLTPTKQRYEDSREWTQNFIKEFRIFNRVQVFIAAQFQADAHGIVLDPLKWTSYPLSTK